jgi:hypothetical protein
MPYGDVETYHEQGQWRNRIESETGDPAIRQSR